MSQLARELVQLRARLFNVGAITVEERALLQEAIEVVEQAQKTEPSPAPEHRPGQSIYFAGESSREPAWNPDRRGD